MSAFQKRIEVQCLNLRHSVVSLRMNRYLLCFCHGLHYGFTPIFSKFLPNVEFIGQYSLVYEELVFVFDDLTHLDIEVVTLPSVAAIELVN